jgi:hypothetical protein
VHRPTATQRVRAFLDAEGVRLAPWTTLNETYRQLYGMLAERRDDAAFWPSLRALLESLADDVACGGVAVPVAELLDGREIERLVAELRRALPSAGRERAPLTDFTASLAAPALCGFLLLGLAASAGCASPDETARRAVPTPAHPPVAAVAPISSPSPTPGTADAGALNEAPPPDAAWFDGCALEKKGVLWRHIDRSSLGDARKSALCDCFAALDRRWTNRLSFLFRNGRPAEIAKALEEMVTCCEAEDKAADTACRDVAKTGAAVQQRALLSEVGGVLYKGVAFGSD